MNFYSVNEENARHPFLSFLGFCDLTLHPIPSGDGEMTIQELLKAVSKFPSQTPYSDRLSAVLSTRKPTEEPGTDSRHTMKDSLLGWLSDYDRPGYYKRKNTGQSAKFMYNHLQSAASIIYLAEAAGVSEELLARAVQAASDPLLRTCASQSGAARALIPWRAVEMRLESRDGEGLVKI